MLHVEILPLAHVFPLDGEAADGVLQTARPGNHPERHLEAAGGGEEGDVVLHLGRELVHETSFHHQGMVGLHAEERQQVHGKVRADDGRIRGRPEAVLGQTAEHLESEGATRKMEGEASARKGVVEAQFPVLPGAEDEAAAQLLEEGSGRDLHPIGVPSCVQARKAGAFEFGGITRQRMGVILRLQAGRKAAMGVIQLHVVVGAPRMLGGADDAVVQVVDGIGLHAAGHASPFLRLKGHRKESHPQKEGPESGDYWPAHFFTWASSSCSSPGR